MIPKECRIGDTCFMSFATIGGNLYTRDPNNLKHVHIYSKDLMSVIIILGTDYDGGETVSMMERIWMTLEKYHMYWSIHMEGVLLLPLIKVYMRALFGPVIYLFYRLSSTNQYFFTLCIVIQDFMTNIYHHKTRKDILMMTGVEFPQTRG